MRPCKHLLDIFTFDGVSGQTMLARSVICSTLAFQIVQTTLTLKCKPKQMEMGKTPQTITLHQLNNYKSNC